MIKILGTKDDAEMYIEFHKNDMQLLYLTGTKPIIRSGLTIEKAKKVLENAGFTYKIFEI